MQWKKLFDANEIRRLTYVCGTETILRELVLQDLRSQVSPTEYDYVGLTAGIDSEADIFAAMNQYSLTSDKARRFIVIRDADRIEHWEQVTDWLTSRRMPHVIVVMMSDLPSWPKDVNFVTKKKTPKYPEIYDRITTSGRYVECKVSRSPSGEQDVETLVMGWGGIDVSKARYLLERVDWDLSAAYECLRKANSFHAPVTRKMLEILSAPSVSTEFVGALMAMDKKSALAAARLLSADDLSTAIGVLNYQLDVASRIYAAQVSESTVYGLTTKLGIHRVQVLALQPVARFYDPARVKQCMRALASADAAQARGATDGVAEVLVSLW